MRISVWKLQKERQVSAHSEEYLLVIRIDCQKGGLPAELASSQ